MARDDETRNHILRTQHYVKAIALRLREMGNYKIELSDEMIKLLFKAAPLHDIGKVGIPNSILHKSGRLNDEEWQVMKMHASIGRAILSSAELETQGSRGVIRVGIKIAGEHHEKWDGSGYPNGLKGEKISLPARIMAIADAYDALMSKHIYKSGWSHEDVVYEIVSQRGAHFDPLVVDAFMIEKAEFLKYLEYNGILYTRIKEVTEEDVDTLVYDLEVKNNHNYSIFLLNFTRKRWHLESILDHEFHLVYL
jgi:HD-GYP domain-containing protein (c-di-GMP phosphodiesterase class II)